MHLKRIPLYACLTGLILLASPAAQAGILSTTLSASTLTVYEGQSFSLNGSQSYASSGYYNSRYSGSGGSGNGYWYNYGGSYSSATSLQNQSGSLLLSDGRSANSLGGTFTTFDEGLISASYSGSFSEYQSFDNTWGWGHYDSYSCGFLWLFTCYSWSSDSGGSQYGNTSWHNYASNTLAITVLNADPVISALTLGATELMVGDVLDFSALASDPGVRDILTLDWDFTGDGTSDFQGDHGQWHFDSAGLYTVQLRVSDGDGGVALRSASVNVNAATSDTPEPASLLLAGLGLGALALGRRRR